MTGGEEKKNIYRTIVKATGLFGGTQVFTILCSIIKTKLVAIWLGAEGVGIIGLYCRDDFLVDKIGNRNEFREGFIQSV